MKIIINRIRSEKYFLALKYNIFSFEVIIKAFVTCLDLQMRSYHKCMKNGFVLQDEISFSMQYTSNVNLFFSFKATK